MWHESPPRYDLRVRREDGDGFNRIFNRQMDIVINENRIVSEAITSVLGGCFLDNDWILWKHTKEGFIGKRCVTVVGNGNVWIEDLKGREVKYWHHGKDGDYKEIFNKWIL